MASLIIAAVFMAPLTFFAVIVLPVVLVEDKKKKMVIQILGGIVAVGLWTGVHHLAWTLYPAWGLVQGGANFLLFICAAASLTLIGADKLS